jgi:hypothetical protein
MRKPMIDGWHEARDASSRTRALPSSRDITEVHGKPMTVAGKVRNMRNTNRLWANPSHRAGHRRILEPYRYELMEQCRHGKLPI